MSSVKPRRVIPPKIVQPGTGVRGWLWVLFLVVLGAWSWQLFDYGRESGGFDGAARDRVEARLQEQVSGLEAERAQLRAELARLQRSSQIDRAATDEVRAQVKVLQDERAELKSEVAFLRGLVSGGDGELLRLSKPSLVLGPDGDYVFEVTLSKDNEQDQATVMGRVTISVVGQQDGKEQRLAMKKLTKGRRSNIGIKFRKYQKLTTEMTLPEGFEPTSIKVAVNPKGSEFKPFQQVYAWKLTDA